MEGPKSFAEKPQSHESVESLTESIEHATELLTELQTFSNVEVIGGDAMALNDRAEELAAELKLILQQIPAKDCIENGLPYHPLDKKEVQSVETPFPAQPDYPLPYAPAANENRLPTNSDRAA
jgi:hypothetical protein